MNIEFYFSNDWKGFSKYDFFDIVLLEFSVHHANNIYTEINIGLFGFNFTINIRKYDKRNI